MLKSLPSAFSLGAKLQNFWEINAGYARKYTLFNKARLPFRHFATLPH
jgi:hypothetical protein